MDAKQRFHPLDRLIADDSLFFLEAMVPFVDYSLKKPLVLFIKYRELMSILHCLDDRPYIESCGFDYHAGNTEDMISHMCNFLPGNFASSIKQMQQMMSMMEMMNMSEKMNMPEMANMPNDMQMQEMANVPNHMHMPEMTNMPNERNMANIWNATNMSEMMNTSNEMNMPEMLNSYQAEHESFPPDSYLNFDDMFASAENSYNNPNSSHGADLYESVLAILENESKE